MKVQFKQVSSSDQEEAVICGIRKTESIRRAMDILEHGIGSIAVMLEGNTHLCRMDQIYYVESVDKRTYVYTKDQCFESKSRIYELEEELDSNFLRCAKAMIVNLRKIRSVKSEYNGRMLAQLLNGETIVVSRSYVKDLKRRLGI
ncbi:MAG: LytTR family transcriptional regulator [Lachnospiraceae bacterium]|nr:LytTR family transcriptional regulator [Lachnospiraceae bacterium]